MINIRLALSLGAAGDPEFKNEFEAAKKGDKQFNDYLVKTYKCSPAQLQELRNCAKNPFLMLDCLKRDKAEVTRFRDEILAFDELTPDGQKALAVLDDLLQRAAAAEANAREACLPFSLDEAVKFAELGSWDGAASQANERLTMLGYTAEAQRYLAPFALLVKHGDALKACTTGGPLAADYTPRDLLVAEAGWRGLGELQAAARAKGPGAAPKGAWLAERIGDVVAATGDKVTGDRLLRGFAAQAVLDGRPADALALLKAKGFAPGSEKSKAAAAALLRDLQVLALGEGEVQTPLGADAIGNPGRGGRSTRGPPPGMQLLLPLENVNDWRPSQGDTVGADLPPLPETLKKVEGPAKRKFEEAVDRETRVLEREKKILLVKSYQRLGRPVPARYAPGKAGQDDEDEDAFLADVEQRLGRPLSPAERDQVRAWRRQHYTIYEIVVMLKR
jgi:hypothetical protein